MKRTFLLTLACISAAILTLAVLPYLKTEREPFILPAAEETADPTTPTLRWWDRQIDIAVQAEAWRVAADFADRKAAYFLSVKDSEQAERWKEQSRDYAAHETESSAPEVPEPTAAGQWPAILEAYVAVTAAAPANSAKFEPQSGVYLGMLGADKRVGFNFNKIEPVYGRKHAMYLSYVGWRKVQSDPQSYFPVKQAETVKALGGALQIGWEPRYGLDDVRDDEYVRTFAREAKASGIPIFLRYASEMNGAWVPWHGDPKKYIEKFRLIHDIMKEEAPNVVMVWSPNFVPADTLDDYYPGDDYVDWVGYSLYATGGPLDKADDFSGFLQSFEPLSGKYPGKPIMISEGAASSYNLAANQSYERWAEGQLGDLYAYLTRIYPRVKAVTYFNYGKERAIRNKMDAVYDLGENPFADALYQRLIGDDLYLSRVAEGARTKEQIVYLPWSQITAPLQGRHKLFTRVSFPRSKQPFAVGYYQEGRLLGMAYELPWEIELDFSVLDPAQPLTIAAYDRRMEKLAESSIVLP